ncbi:MAG: hypothetical protein NTZ18_04255 [Candidatus Komeilibacteria bacterium]|nr:hypothetical protein [Candidatus Komeilibacteria bacterium]
MDVKSILDQIPTSSMFVSLLGRHTYSYQDGGQFSRTITSKGVALCDAVRHFYEDLGSSLMETFGLPEISCSSFIRSALTVWEITHSCRIEADPRLNIPDGASLKTLSGDWYQLHCYEADGVTKRSVSAILKDFFGDDSLNKSAFNRYGENYLGWAKDFGPNRRLRITWAHEIGCSLAAGPYLTEGVEPGLEECEGYLLCFDGTRNCLIAIKIVPDQR